MLKIKAPIECKTNTDVTTVGDAFGERIRGNYGVMGSGINGEELLHLVSQPPEIYLGDGGMTNLVAQTNVANRQETKVNIINNFLNRVAVGVDAKLTYQDRVFISNVLNQLGIRDEKSFMQEVMNVKNEVKQTENLVNLYWNNLSRLENIVSEYQENVAGDNVNMEEKSESTELHLHEDIMNRLSTAAIYKIVSNFNSRTAGDTFITNEEYRLSEQSRITENVLLTRLQGMVTGERTPLVFRHENVYEESYGGDTIVDRSQVENRVTSAVLLNLIDNIFQTRHETMRRGGDKFYHMEDSFFESAENTINRIENNTDRSLSLINNYSSSESRVEALSEEIDMVTNILHESRLLEQRIKVDADLRSYRSDMNAEGARITYKTTREGDILEGDQVSRTEISSRSGDSIREGDTFVREGDSLVHKEGDNVQVTEQLDEAEAIVKQLEIMNQQNIERTREYQNNLHELVREYKEVPKENSRKRQLDDSLKALESPMQFLREAKAEDAQGKVREKDLEAAKEALLDEKDQRTLNLVREYVERPERFIESNIVTRDNFLELERDIQRVERQRASKAEQKKIEEDEAAKQKTIETVTETVTETVRELRRKEPGIMVDERPAEKLSLVHKRQDTQIDEELLEEIVNQNRRIDQQTERIDTIVNNTTTEKQTVVNNVEKNTVLEENYDITEAVARSVRGQVDTITEKVYDKLSRRLADEKRRRGV